jgi:hypothetical protein
MKLISPEAAQKKYDRGLMLLQEMQLPKRSKIYARGFMYWVLSWFWHEPLNPSIAPCDFYFLFTGGRL